MFSSSRLANNESAAACTAVPLKKSRFPEVQNSTALVKTMSRKASALMTPCSNQLVSLLCRLRHLGHIPMAKIGAIQRLKFRVEGRALSFGGERVQWIIALASEVEPRVKISQISAALPIPLGAHSSNDAASSPRAILPWWSAMRVSARPATCRPP